ncbi:MAG: GNAT family N-acetyltransferase [Rhodobacteraceae bacterium]|nr:GNAT family N-acetyltransferase [Paracoccaceae bacterium]
MTPSDIFAAQEATWPPAAKTRVGPWCIRDGQGGGKRVSAASAEAPVTAADIPLAEAAMADLGQPALFMIRPGDEDLDAALAARGYRVVDPVTILSAPLATVATQPPPPVSAFTVWEPLAIMQELWDENDIGPARRAVMARVQGPKTAILGRQNDRAAGVAFAAVDGEICFVHAVAVSDAHRRQGTAINMMRAAAFWAQDQGATSLAVLVVEANRGACALYASLGLANVGHYHYRTNAPQQA